MKFRLSIFIYFFMLLSEGLGATTRRVTLDEAIAIARMSSVDAAVALNRLKASYWEYRTYKAQFLPEVSFSATLPSYNKKYSAYQLEDGSFTFVRDNNLQINGSVSIDQNISLTGGKLSLNSTINYLKQLDGSKDSRFMSLPVALTLTQPLFGVNTLKWDKRIEPVKYREAQADYLEATEQVAMETITAYFNLLLAQSAVAVASQNLDNAETLYEIAKVKRSMGQISKNDLLQMELNRLEARSTLTSAKSTEKSAMFSLRSFLALDDNDTVVPLIPDEVRPIAINYDDALEKAMRNNSVMLNTRRRQLEADYAVAKAKGDLRQINLFAQIGFTGTDNEFSGAYNRLKDNQVVEIGVSIPILDWGKRRGKVKMAESNRQVVVSQLRQQNLNFRQDLFILVERFNNQQQQVDIAASADAIAATRYDTNVKTFPLGKISTLDLNDSQVKKDEAKAAYINELYLYWLYFYQLRGLTLWDFVDDTDIDEDFDRIVR